VVWHHRFLLAWLRAVLAGFGAVITATRAASNFETLPANIKVEAMKVVAWFPHLAALSRIDRAGGATTISLRTAMLDLKLSTPAVDVTMRVPSYIGVRPHWIASQGTWALRLASRPTGV
jgi:hypothetical protein